MTHREGWACKTGTRLESLNFNRIQVQPVMAWRGTTVPGPLRLKSGCRTKTSCCNQNSDDMWSLACPDPLCERDERRATFDIKRERRSDEGQKFGRGICRWAKVRWKRQSKTVGGDVDKKKDSTMHRRMVEVLTGRGCAGLLDGILHVQARRCRSGSGKSSLYRRADGH